ncbi:MAG: chorismate mutase [Candidatus Melainabacteria bacterium GWA2_34_9]|nr:MAG: chorismate mutase [Candidatus Melainabacteria bacterium GWA2_34_9]
MQNIPISRAVRGATTVENNVDEEIYQATVELLKKMIEENSIDSDEIINVIFTLTHDLDAAFPAKAARVHLGWNTVPMICTQEIPVPESLQKCIRVLITFNTAKSKDEIRHIYLRKAQTLRPDLVK